MVKAKTNYIIDVLMTIASIIVGGTGLILFFFLPSGVKQGRYQEFLGIPKHIIADIHDWSGIIIIVLVLIHIILHWKWIVRMTKNMFSRKKNKK